MPLLPDIHSLDEPAPTERSDFAPLEAWDAIAAGYADHVAPGEQSVSAAALRLVEMVRVAKPGGRVLLVDYGAPSEFEALKFFISALQLVAPLTAPLDLGRGRKVDC